jgi:hypothetical protein
MKCYHHPKRKADFITNLGTPIDLDTPVCALCALNIQNGKESGVCPNATIRRIEASDSSGEENEC